MRTIHRIVVPTDFSACSLHAVDDAVDLAGRFGARLYLLHVPVTYHDVLDELTEQRLEVDDTMQRHSVGNIDAHLAALAPRLQGTEYETAVRTGPVTSTILKYAHEVDADLIVMGTHGRRGLARMFVGSTAEGVVRSATLPVITVPPRPDPMHTVANACIVHDPACNCLKETTNFRALAARRGGSIRVRDAMRRDVVKVGPTTHVHDVVDAMIRHDISGVPVVNESGELRGYIPESHLLARTLANMAPNGLESDEMDIDALVQHQRKLCGKLASDVMCPTSEVVTIEESAPLAEAIRRMLDNRVSRLPVLRAGRIVGYLTRADILRVLRSLEEHTDSDLTDRDVERLVREALGRDTDVAVTDLRVDTEHGVVTLHGSVSSASELESAAEVVMKLPGVKAVANCILVEQLLH